MTLEPRIGPQGRDDDVTRALRELYAAPSDPGYWDRLEARVLARIAADADAWWSPFGGWGRLGVIAAGIAALAVGAALSRARQVEARVAYEHIVETPRTLGEQIATATTGLPPREATLRYVLEP